MRLLLALIVAAHGMGHILFLVPLLGLADWGQPTRSWLLSERLGSTPTVVVGGVIWVAALAGFMVAGLGLYSQAAWWRTLAVVASAVASFIGLLLFWQQAPTSPALMALVFNIVVLGALLVAHWPSPEALAN